MAELPHFQIEGVFGGNQNWFRDPMMYLGGCGALTACDLCINLARYHCKELLYPDNVQHIKREDYIRFGKRMKPYLRPRFGGIKTLHLFIEGFQAYLQDVGERELRLSAFEGDRQAVDAEAAVRQQIDQGIPIPYLLLKHKNPHFKDYVWHWFLLTGYESRGDKFFVKTATYGGFHWFPLQELWQTGYTEQGGMVLLE